MRWLLLLAGCADAEGDDASPPDDEADTDTDTDSDADSDADSDTDADTDADTDTPPVDRTGTYTGTMDLIVGEHTDLESPFATCIDPAFTLVVDAKGAVTGGGGCTMPYPLDGLAFTATLTGTVTDDALSGTMTGTWPSLPAPEEDDWSGTFLDADTIDGHFENHWTDGTLTIDWGAEFVLVRL